MVQPKNKKQNGKIEDKNRYWQVFFFSFLFSFVYEFLIKKKQGHKAFMQIKIFNDQFYNNNKYTS